MTNIKSKDNALFTIEKGLEVTDYPKNFYAQKVDGKSFQILSFENGKHLLLDAWQLNNVTIEGVTYTEIDAAVSALNSFLYAASGGGNPSSVYATDANGEQTMIPLSDFGTVKGTGTTNRISKFTASGTIGDSQIFDDGTKIGIHNETPEYTLDIQNEPAVETQLTGTFSFDGMMITGLDTLMLSEIQSGGTIKVLSTGEEYVVDFIMSDTDAFSFSGGNQFNNEICVITVSNGKYLNVFGLLKSFLNFGETTRENNEKVVYNNSEKIYNSTGQNIQIETNLLSGGYYSHAIRRNGILVANLYIVEENGLTGLRIADNSGHGITFYSNHTIKITGLTTAIPPQPNFLYKDSNGFLKIS